MRHSWGPDVSSSFIARLRQAAKVQCPHCSEMIPNGDERIRNHLISQHGDNYPPGSDLDKAIRDLKRSRIPPIVNQQQPTAASAAIASSSSEPSPRARSSSPVRRSRASRSTPASTASDSDHTRATYRYVPTGKLWNPDQDATRTKSPKASTTSGRSSTIDVQDGDGDSPRLIKQPETRQISQEQLVAEVKGIYAGLVMVESKCIEVDNALSSQADTRLNNEQWQALIALHRKQLDEQHDRSSKERRHSDGQPRRKRVLRPTPHTTDRDGDELLQRRPGKQASSNANDESSPTTEWRVRGDVNGLPVDALADTGASINAISKAEADRIGLRPESHSAGKKIRLPNGNVCRSLGVGSLDFTFEGEETVHKLCFNIVKQLEQRMIVCYDFLQRTETLTRHFKNRIKEIATATLPRFRLCLLEDDDADLGSGPKARMNGFIGGAPATVVPDTGSGVMAVSARFARRHGLQIDRSRRTRVTLANGSVAVTSGVVQAAWGFLSPDPQHELWSVEDGGQVDGSHKARRVVASPDTEWKDDLQNDEDGDYWDYEYEYEWHVIDDLPVDAILSLDFIKRHDVFGRHQHAFVPYTPPYATLAEIFGIVAKENQGLADLETEFLVDLNTLDPFTYQMCVRENARRKKIQLQIEHQPVGQQGALVSSETARIASWERLKDAQRNGGDWLHLRDEYLSTIRQLPLSGPSSGMSQRQAATVSAPTVTTEESGNPGIKGLWRWRSRVQKKATAT